jgi:hypothetical protein
MQAVLTQFFHCRWLPCLFVMLCLVLSWGIYAPAPKPVVVEEVSRLPRLAKQNNAVKSRLEKAVSERLATQSELKAAQAGDTIAS